VSEHVVLVTSSYPAHPADAAGHFVRAEALRLARSGARVRVIAPAAARSETDDCGVRLVRVADGGAFGFPGALARLRARPARGVGIGRFVAGARRALVEHGPIDRVVAHWLVPAGWPIASAVRAPLEVVAHGSDVRLLLAAPALLRRRMVAHWLGRETAFRFVSWELAHAFAEATDLALLERARVELPALELDGVPDRATARRQLGIAEEARLLLVVARLTRQKRVGVALGAASLLPDVDRVVLGDGPERTRLERSFPGVRFMGWLERDACLTWIAAADLVLSASREEGAPTALREARALGVPVVATRVGDLALWAETDPDLHVISRF
jgi:glycosyltransferase involved in cell wall biosynthesis